MGSTQESKSQPKTHKVRGNTVRNLIAWRSLLRNIVFTSKTADVGLNRTATGLNRTRPESRFDRKKLYGYDMEPDSIGRTGLDRTRRISHTEQFLPATIPILRTQPVWEFKILKLRSGAGYPAHPLGGRGAEAGAQRCTGVPRTQTGNLELGWAPQHRNT